VKLKTKSVPFLCIHLLRHEGFPFQRQRLQIILLRPLPRQSKKISSFARTFLLLPFLLPSCSEIIFLNVFIIISLRRSLVVLLLLLMLMLMVGDVAGRDFIINSIQFKTTLEMCKSNHFQTHNQIHLFHVYRMMNQIDLFLDVSALSLLACLLATSPKADKKNNILTDCR